MDDEVIRRERVRVVIRRRIERDLDDGPLDLESRAGLDREPLFRSGFVERHAGNRNACEVLPAKISERLPRNAGAKVGTAQQNPSILAVALRR